MSSLLRWQDNGSEEVLATGDANTVSTADSEEGELLIRQTLQHIYNLLAGLLVHCWSLLLLKNMLYNFSGPNVFQEYHNTEGKMVLI